MNIFRKVFPVITGLIFGAVSFYILHTMYEGKPNLKGDIVSPQDTWTTSIILSVIGWLLGKLFTCFGQDDSGGGDGG